MERESHPIMKEIIKHKITHNVNRLKTSLKWVVFAILSGVLVGSVGTLFYLCMALVTLVRTKNPWLIFLLPVGGILIVGAYRLLHDERDTGTNLVLSAIHSGDELPLRMAPLIFISTLTCSAVLPAVRVLPCSSAAVLETVWDVCFILMRRTSTS